MTNEHTFLVMWCNEGLEGIIDITEHEQKQIWEALKGKEIRSPFNLNTMIMRARFNPQRHYEIYIISAQEGITADDIRGMFDASPQTAADTIRAKGKQLYSDRAVKSKEVII